MQTTPKGALQRAIDAATTLLTEPADGANRPEKHRLLCCGGPALPDDLREAMAFAARGVGADIAYLDFGRGSPAKGVGRVRVGISAAYATIWSDDCALWSGEHGGPLLIVPRGPGAAGHFAFDGTRLEFRDGRPAKSLAAGMLRADRRMREAAQASRAEERGSWLHVQIASAA